MNILINTLVIHKQLLIITVYVFIFIVFISCKEVDPNFDAIGDIKKGNIHFISYGFSMPFPNSNWKVIKQIDNLNTYYGIKYDNRGCVLPDSIELIKIDEYNKKVENYLETINDKGWRKKYTRQLDSLEKMKLLIDSIK